MKRWSKVLGSVLLFLLLLVTSSFAGPHEIMYFRDNKAGAVSLALDDGYQSQVTAGLSQLNTRGVKGTFFVVTLPGWIDSHVPWDTWQIVAAQGHEIGSHTMTHPNLTWLPVDDLAYELGASQSAINQNGGSQFCIALAYPEGESNATVQSTAANYYVAARGTWVPEGGILNHYQAGSDMYGSWQQLNFYNTGAYSTADTMDPADAYFNTLLDVAVLRHAWATVIFHDITNPTGFGKILDQILTKDVWVDTYGNVSRYMKERLFSQIQVVNDTAAEIRLRIVLNASLWAGIYNVPLTLRSNVPGSWPQVRFQQGGNTQTLTPVTEGSDTVVYYNAVPNGGDVLLTDAGDGNPAPVLTKLTPSSARQGSGGFYITVYGNNFVPGSIVRWNQMNRRTIFISATELQAWVMPSDLTRSRVSQVWVTNPAPGGGDSNVLYFTIR